MGLSNTRWSSQDLCTRPNKVSGLPIRDGQCILTQLNSGARRRRNVGLSRGHKKQRQHHSWPQSPAPRRRTHRPRTFTHPQLLLCPTTSRISKTSRGLETLSHHTSLSYAYITLPIPPKFSIFIDAQSLSRRPHW